MTPLTAGIDAGSSSIKVAIMTSEQKWLGRSIQRIRRRQVDQVVQSAFAEACEQAGVVPADFDYIASTGDGDRVPFHSGHFFGMTTHSRGGVFLMPHARAVLDMGALHARAILIDERGKVLGHRMTSQCASGSGQFLENIARYLGVPLEDIGMVSLQSQQPENVSSICAVLSETDVINMVSRGIQAPDILKGIHLSMAGRLIRLLDAMKARGTVALTGGLACDKGLIAALNEIGVHLTLQSHPDSVFAGALGAALLAAQRYKQLKANSQCA